MTVSSICHWQQSAVTFDSLYLVVVSGTVLSVLSLVVVGSESLIVLVHTSGEQRNADCVRHY